MIRIQIINVPDYVPDKFRESDGTVFIDLKDGVTISQSKDREGLTDLNKLRRRRTIPFDIPSSEKNDSIFHETLNINTVLSDSFAFTVIIFVGSRILPENTLYVRKSKARGTKNYEGVVVNNTHWMDLASKITLRDIPIGRFRFTRDNIELNLIRDHKYVDGDLGIWFPLVNYNNIGSLTNLPFAMHRPHFHMLSILQKGFAAIGYSFSCPALETDIGRRIGTYILDEEYEALGSSQVIPLDLINDYLGLYNFFGNTFPNIGLPKWTKIVFTGNNNNNPAYHGLGQTDAGSYVDCLTADHILNFYFLFIDKVDLKIRISVEYQGVSFDVFYEEYIDTFGGPIQVTLDAFQMYEGMSMSLHIWISEIVQGFMGEATWVTSNETGCIRMGDELNLETLLREDAFLDYVKGCEHLLSGLIDTNEELRQVTLYTPYDFNWYGDDVIGYFNGNVVDMQDHLIVDSFDVSKEIEQTQKRFINLGFKKSTCGYIKSKKFKEEIFLQKLDLGDGYVSGDPQKSLNPYFEPTLNDWWSPPNEIADNNAKINTPFMWGNENGKYDTGIEPRVIIFHGITRILSEGNDGFSTISMLGFQELNIIPVAYQSSDAFTSDGVTATQISQKLVYGSQLDDSLYSLVYKKYIKATLQNIEIEALFTVDDLILDKLLFRNVYTFNWRDQTAVAFLLEINDHQLGSEIPTPLKFQPLISESILIEELEPLRIGFCPNRVKLFTSLDACQYTVGIVNENLNDIVEQVTEWQYQTDDGIWTTANVISNPTGNFIIRTTTTYDTEITNCQKNVTTILVDPCVHERTVRLEWTTYVQDNQNCVIINLVGIDISTITNIEWNAFYLTDKNDPSTEVPFDYELGSVFCHPDMDKVCVSPEITRTCGCPEIIKDEECKEYPPDVVDCSKHTLDVECFEDSPGCWTAIRTGLEVTAIATDFILYRCTEIEVWKLWDEVTPICCDTIFFKRVISFCGSICDIVCKYAECMSVVDPCDCFAEINCIGCVVSINPICDGYVWDWYDMNNQAEGVTPTDDIATIESLVNAELIGSGNSLDLPMGNFADGDSWIAAIGKKATCDDILLYYWFDKPQAGDDVTIDL